MCSPSQVLADVYTEVLEATHPLHRGPTDHKRSVGPLLSLPEVHNQLFGFAHVQRETVTYAFSRRFYPKRLTIAFRLYIFISTCVPWESNPQPFVLLKQCSTTEPHRNRRQLSWHHDVSLSTSSKYAASSSLLMRPRTTVSSANLTILT